MAYCTRSDIEKQIPEEILIQLTDDEGTGLVDTDNVDRAIEDADDEIDSFLALAYSLPLASVPGLVRRMSVDLAVCNLYGRRPHLTIPDTRKERCDADRKLLEKIGAGKLSLGGDAPAPSSDSGVETTKTRSDRVFTTGRVSDGSTGTLDNY
jgi:phage gp36-like protein